MYYKDKANGILDANLFTTKAEAEAKKLVQARFTSSQFRNYFSELRQLEDKLDADEHEQAFERMLPFLKMIHAKLAYKTSQGTQTNRGAAKAFQDFLGIAINAVQDREDFDPMMKYVESVLAYFYANGGR